MTGNDAARVLSDVAGGRYESAFGIPFDAPREALNRAHIRLSFRHRDNPELREALNRAKGVLASERPLERGRRLIRIERREEALAQLERAVDEGLLAGTELAEGRHLLGYVLYQLGRYRDARAQLEQAVDLRGSASDHVWLGTTLERLEAYDAAVDRYRAAVNLRDHATECQLLGNVLVKMERYDEALPALDRAVELGLVDHELLERRRMIRGRRTRRRLVHGVQSAFSRIRRDPIDWVLMGLVLAYGVYFCVQYL